LQQMINLNPKFIVTSNSFLVKNYGHHEIFEVESNLISKKNISKIFRDTMINNKYKIDGRCNKFWNRRPVIWSKV